MLVKKKYIEYKLRFFIANKNSDKFPRVEVEISILKKNYCMVLYKLVLNSAMSFVVYMKSSLGRPKVRKTSVIDRLNKVKHYVSKAKMDKL